MSGGVKIFSYEMMKNIPSPARISKILDAVLAGAVVMLEGRISREEETELITSALQNVSGKFSGIEIAFLDNKKSSSFGEKLRQSIIKILAKDRIGITVVGPSKIIKDIKMDPDKLEILFKK
jgi:hypothetical protein